MRDWFESLEPRERLFVGVGAVVVELFGAVVVADVAITLGANRDVAGAEAGAGDMRPLGVGILEQRSE